MKKGLCLLFATIFLGLMASAQDNTNSGQEPRSIHRTLATKDFKVSRLDALLMFLGIAMNMYGAVVFYIY